GAGGSLSQAVWYRWGHVEVDARCSESSAGPPLLWQHELTPLFGLATRPFQTCVWSLRFLSYPVRWHECASRGSSSGVMGGIETTVGGLIYARSCIGPLCLIG
ncbi:unnamed protein product, partial [Ectocarpus fasciculatus]